MRIGVLLVLLIILVGFLGAWAYLAQAVPAWSDEISHLSAAVGILKTGQPFHVAFDRNAQILSENLYVRGIEVTRLAALAFQLFGVSVPVARLVPLVFILLTWLLFIGYQALRGISPLSAAGAASALLFFGQSMVLEQALYVRVYAPMGLLLLLAMIALWEGFQAFKRNRPLRAIAWWGVMAVCVGVTTPRWHLIPLPVMLLGAYLLRERNRVALAGLPLAIPDRFRRLPLGRKCLLGGLAIYGVLSVGAVTTWWLDALASKLFGVQRAFSIYWDNLIGLTRFLLGVNVLLWIWVRGVLPRLKERMEFEAWLLSVGLISGLAIGLLMNHNYIFYSRFFYCSVILTVLGASHLIRVLSTRQTAAAVAAYLFLNAFVSWGTFRWDRSNIREAVAWLRQNTDSGDILLTFNSDLSLHGWGDLCDRAYPILREQYELPRSGQPVILELKPRVSTGITSYLYRDPARASRWYIPKEELKRLLNAHPQAGVYFLFTDHYQFRDRLFQRTTGKSRTRRKDLFGLLKEGDSGRELIPGLRSCGLRELDRKRLLAALENLDE